MWSRMARVYQEATPTVDEEPEQMGENGGGIVALHSPPTLDALNRRNRTLPPPDRTQLPN